MAMANDSKEPEKLFPWYVSYCPVGGECKKGNKRLGCFSSVQTAKSAIVSHLTGSAYHYMEPAEAHKLAADADLDVVSVGC